MKILHKVLCIMSLVSAIAPLHACDMGGTNVSFVPSITGSEIKRSPSYDRYENSNKTIASSWDEVANTIVFKKTGKYHELSNSHKASFDLGGLKWASVDDYLKSVDSKDLETMARAIYAKFAQNSTLKNLLLSTEGKILVDDSDKGKGNNYLGRILMLVRLLVRKHC